MIVRYFVAFIDRLIDLAIRARLRLVPSPAQVMRNDMDADLERKLRIGVQLDDAWMRVAAKTTGKRPALIRRRA